jgi:tetratricopeptide (TPR) repeat protein
LVSSGGASVPPAGGEGPRYDAAELAALAGVPTAVLRAWAERGLLPRPRAGARKCYDFRALSRARTLARLRAAGWRPAALDKARRRARILVDDDDEALAGLEGGPREREVTVRLSDGRRCQDGGQGVFDFDAAAGEARGGGVLGLRTAGEWFQIGVEAEAAHRLEDAVRAYRRALPSAGAAAHFNLGNCLYELGDQAAAAAAFEAAVAAAPDYAEAWNNLGIARSALQRGADAIAAFRRALQLVPHYADAHYNLADALAAAGDVAAARGHWRAYLTYDPNSRWAEQVRRRLLDGGAS